MSEELKFETTITARNGWFDINFRELWKYRDLIFMFVKRDFISRYKQTILGPLWALIQPLLTTVVFTIVFGALAKMPTDGVPPFLFYMNGNIAWAFFAGCITQTANTFVGNAAIFGKVYFPRLTMPIAVVFSQLISFAIQLFLFCCILAWYCISNKTCTISLNIWYYPFLLLQMGILGLGCGIIISSVTTKYRDLMMLVAFGVQLWMYASAVVYPVSMIPEKYQSLFLMNPMAVVIESSRNLFFGGSTLSMMHYGISWGITLIVLIAGVVLFSKVEKNFMDTI